MSCIADSFLLFKIYNYFSSFSERESTPKYYFADNGLLNLFLTDKRSALLENAVAIWLKQHYGDEVCYIKSAVTGLDIDFYILSEHTAIQVCLELNNQSSGREIDNLIKASACMPDLNRLIVIIYDETDLMHPDRDKVEVLPIDVFMLKGLGRS